MKKLLFLFMLLASSMTCLAQKFTPGEYVESGEGKGDLYIPSRITLQNGRFTCKAMSGFPTFTSGSDLAYLEFASNFTGSHTVSGTYTASNGNLRLTVTSVTPALKWRGNYQLVRNYTFSYDSNSITIGSKTLYNRTAQDRENAAEEARARREEAAAMVKVKKMETRLAPICAKEKQASKRPVIYVAATLYGSSSYVPKTFEEQIANLEDVDIRVLYTDHQNLRIENNALQHSYEIASEAAQSDDIVKCKLYITKYADEVCVIETGLSGSAIHHFFPASGKQAIHNSGVSTRSKEVVTSYLIKYIAENYSPSLKARVKEKEEKLAAAKKEREDKIAAIKAELTQKYGGNRFRIILDPPRYYDQNKDIRQALVKELKASTAIALLDKVPQLPKKSVDEMNDQELREYLMATYFAPEATVQLEYKYVSVDIKKKESKVRLFSNLPEQSVIEANAQYYIEFVDPKHHSYTEIIYASGEVSGIINDQNQREKMSAAEKKALTNVKPIYDAIVKYAKKMRATNASGESSSASGTSSPSLSGSRAKVGPARVSTGTQTSKSSTTSTGNHWW